MITFTQVNNNRGDVFNTVRRHPNSGVPIDMADFADRTLSGLPPGASIDIRDANGPIASGTADDEGVFRFQVPKDAGKATVTVTVDSTQSDDQSAPA